MIATFGEAVRTNPMDELLSLVMDGDVVSEGDRNYPFHYWLGMAKYRAHPDDVDRMRRGIASVPRVQPELYDILFNGITRCWDIVKWVAMPEPVGVIDGYGFISRVVYEPVDVYSIRAWLRDPSTLGEADFIHMRRWAVTTRGGEKLTEELHESDQRRLAALEAERAAAEADTAEYLHKLLKRMRDETGLGDLSPEEMAARNPGTRAAHWKTYGENGLEPS